MVPAADRPPWRAAALTAQIAATLAAALWLWTHFCYFPWHPWNDLRLAPALMGRVGENVYSTATQGIVTTWTYGPVPLWLWAPAGIASTAAGALLTAGALNIGYTLLSIVLVCLHWPGEASRESRWGAAMLCVALWPGGAWDFMVVDSLTIALGLVSNLCLQTPHKPNPARAWLAAAFCAAALGCKQTSVGLLIVQAAWMGAEHGWRNGLAQLLRSVACGALLLGLAMAQFGVAGPWFGMVEIPSQIPFAPDIAERLSLHRWAVLAHVGLPAVMLLVTRGRWFGQGHPLRLPCLTWLCTLPMSVLGLLSAGGNGNALISGLLLLPPLAVHLLGSIARSKRACVLAAGAVIVVLAAKWPAEHPWPWRPRTEHLAIGAALNRHYRGEIWFSWNPTLALYLQRRATHAEDGLYVRSLTGHDVSTQHLRAGFPPQVQGVIAAEANWELTPSIFGATGKPSRIVGTPWVFYALPVQARSANEDRSDSTP